MAKKKIRELVLNTKCYVKDVNVSAHKIDSILLDRLEKVRKVMETNGTYVLFPQLGSQRGLIRVQGTEILHVERTVREIMALVVNVLPISGRDADFMLGGPILQRYVVPDGSCRSRRKYYACTSTS